MKGIVFSELIDMVESKLGHEVADAMIEKSAVSNRGAYTAVGTYDHEELLSMVAALSEATAAPSSDLVRSFGHHLFHRLRELYPAFFAAPSNALEFLPTVEDLVHVEVKKLYPDAELPEFDWKTDGDTYVMTYRSARPFADLAEGMLRSCVEYFGDDYQLQRQDVDVQNGTSARFTLVPNNLALAAS